MHIESFKACSNRGNLSAAPTPGLSALRHLLRAILLVILSYLHLVVCVARLDAGTQVEEG